MIQPRADTAGTTHNHTTHMVTKGCIPIAYAMCIHEANRLILKTQQAKLDILGAISFINNSYATCIGLPV